MSHHQSCEHVLQNYVQFLFLSQPLFQVQFVHHEAFKDIPKILETPYVGEDKKNKKPPYRFEIEMLKSQIFDPKLKEKILNQ